MRVLCYGDSNTYGYDPRSFFGGRYPAESRWVDILAELTGWEIVNGGENGLEIPKRYSGPLWTQTPDLLIVMLGSNDILQGSSAEDAADRMEHFLECLPIQQNRILLIAPPHMKWGVWITHEHLLEEVSKLGETYEKVAKTLGIAFVDAGKWEISLTFDGVHFDETGHRTFTQELYGVLAGDQCRKDWGTPRIKETE